MTSESDSATPKPSEVSAAVIAMLTAGSALLRPTIEAGALRYRRELKAAALRYRRELTGGTSSIGTPEAPRSDLPGRKTPTPEEIEAAQEAALAAFPEHVRVAARAAFKEAVLRIEGKAPRARELAPPSLTPSDLPERPQVEVPPFPPAGLDDPVERTLWHYAHHAIAEARFRLQPAVLKAFAEAQLANEKWRAKRHGRKPSGDLRCPVPRDRLEQIMEEMRLSKELDIAKYSIGIKSIESGDAVEYIEDDYGRSFPVPVLQLDRRATPQRAKADPTPEEIQADDAEFEELLADLSPEEPEIEIPELLKLPTDREPTWAEIAAVSNYVKKASKIAAKREKDAAIKARTAAKREAEQADPAAAAAAKAAIKRRKAAERQRRLRERRKAAKQGR